MRGKLELTEATFHLFIIIFLPICMLGFGKKWVDKLEA
jgi:hypothetical protein